MNVGGNASFDMEKEIRVYIEEKLEITMNKRHFDEFIIYDK